MILALLSFVVLIVLISANVWVSSLVYHRHLTHRAIDLNKWVARALTLYLQGMAFAPPLSWVASHAAHHAGADTTEDPYSPEVHGFLRVVFLTPLLVTRWRMRSGEMIIAKYTRRVPDRRFYEFCDRTWWCSLMMAAFAGAFFLLLGWAGLLVYAIESYGFYVLMGWFNATGHTQGDRPSQNSGTNRHGARWLFMNLCMAGELLHNHHHHAPHSANFGLAGETDVGYLVCRALAFARLATILDAGRSAQTANIGWRFHKATPEAARGEE
jgi:stearoyl-CoA desaturase (Delta-9 desaturase)